ncbi:plasmid partitioning protein RepB [Roseibium sp. RKSG952]|nr:plasmid partitioning protein RepB [Roseibium sp. RKSG952]
MKKSIVKMMSTAPHGVRTDDSKTEKVTTPVVNSMSRALSHMKEDSIVSLDPAKVDPSPFSDRFELDAEGRTELEGLKLSMRDEGQKIPILVRPHPTEKGRYQLSYGHRRVIAIRELMEESDKPEIVKVKAYVRPLTDAELIKEQSLENGVRENLTFVEMSLWAAKLREAGLKQREMEPILGQVQTVISNMLKISDCIPSDIIYAIGRAKNVGRPAWMKFAATFDAPGAEARVRALIQSDDFKSCAPSDRLARAIKAARDEKISMQQAGSKTKEILSEGNMLASVKYNLSNTTISIPKNKQKFADWLSENLADIHSNYVQHQNKENEDG